MTDDQLDEEEGEGQGQHAEETTRFAGEASHPLSDVAWPPLDEAKLVRCYTRISKIVSNSSPFVGKLTAKSTSGVNIIGCLITR